MSLEAIVWKDGSLKVLDQLLLPLQTEYINVRTVEDGWSVINKMQVRGAPAIAIVGCLSLASELANSSVSAAEDLSSMASTVKAKLEYLVTARPTAVNMATAARQLTSYAAHLATDEASSVQNMKDKIIKWCVSMLEEDVATNKALGDHGAKHILDANNGKQKVTLLTICNTGSLATAGYGTALGVVRSVAAKQALGGVFMQETRPYLQGARLSAYEAVVEQWPNASLVCDGAVAALLKTHDIDAVVVGADRVAANGDTANKIGTYQLAVLCSVHEVPFYVCSPLTSVDLNLASGEDIPIEHRPEKEMLYVAGKRIAPEGIKCWNPAFDVTPARYITGGIVTERGVFRPEELKDAFKDASS